jgi:hypothetical protein
MKFCEKKCSVRKRWRNYPIWRYSLMAKTGSPLPPRNQFLGIESARLYRLAESISWNRFLGFLNVYQFWLTAGLLLSHLSWDYYMYTVVNITCKLARRICTDSHKGVLLGSPSLEFTQFAWLRARLCTDKKEKKNFLIYKEIQKGAVAKSYIRKGCLIYSMSKCANI